MGRSKRPAGPSPSAVLGGKVRQVRLRKGWTAQQHLADSLGELGRPIDRTAVQRIESGNRGVSLDDAFTIATALEVPALSLMLPFDKEAPVAVAPEVTVSSGEAWKWAKGEEPLPGQDRRFFEDESPDFWMEATRWRHVGMLEALTDRLAAALEAGDKRGVTSALDGLSQEIVRLQAESSTRKRGR